MLFLLKSLVKKMPVTKANLSIVLFFHLPAFKGASEQWRRKWQPTPVLLPGESHGRRSLVGYSPQGHKESDTTERLHFHY